MPTLSIITPWRDHPELLADYEQAVRGAEIIVVDNGSTPAHAAQLQALVDRLGGSYLRNEHNTGFAAANNQGLAHARGEIILFLNNDVAAGPGFLEAVLRDVPPQTLVGPAYGRQAVYGIWLPYLQGWCIAGHRAVWEQLHGWDAAAYPDYYWEDVDLCFRALTSGIRLTRRPWPIQHKGGQTIESFARWGESFERNRATLAARVRPFLERLRQPSHPALCPDPPETRTLEELYGAACSTPSDINEHCPTLYALARQCRHVTELGTRTAVSTTALLYAQPDRLVTYDQLQYPQVEALRRLAGRTEFIFHQQDVLTIEIEETDLLFIDTWHVYEQLQAELRLHAGKVRRFIVLHDTTTYGEVGEIPGHRGLWPAIDEFLQQGEFRLRRCYEHNHGLVILQRRQPLLRRLFRSGR